MQARAPPGHSFLYNPKDGTYTTLDVPSAIGIGTVAQGINSSGQIVGYYRNGDPFGQQFDHGFLYNPTDGTYTTLDDPFAAPGPFATVATGINDLGQIVGYFTDANGGQHGFLYTVGTFITLDVPSTPPNGTFPHGINNNQVVGSTFGGHGFLATIGPSLPPPGGTSAIMIPRHGADGLYGIYDIGNNSILVAFQLGHVGTDWQFAGLGDFNRADTSDMLLRNNTTGDFLVYNIANNVITNAAFLGTVGLEWQVMGFGDFSSSGHTDMMLRNANTGGIEVYDITNNRIIGASFMGTVGLNWQFSGVGNFSSLGESDMLLRNSDNGGLEVYDIANNQITNAAFVGTVGLEWQFSGISYFSGVPGETDLLGSLQHREQSAHRRGLRWHSRAGVAVRGDRSNPRTRRVRSCAAQRQ
jgi:probable HAF family extracellular repeat protein